MNYHCFSSVLFFLWLLPNIITNFWFTKNYFVNILVRWGRLSWFYFNKFLFFSNLFSAKSSLVNYFFRSRVITIILILRWLIHRSFYFFFIIIILKYWIVLIYIYIFWKLKLFVTTSIYSIFFVINYVF